MNGRKYPEFEIIVEAIGDGWGEQRKFHTLEEAQKYVFGLGNHVIYSPYIVNIYERIRSITITPGKTTTLIYGEKLLKENSDENG